MSHVPARVLRPRSVVAANRTGWLGAGLLGLGLLVAVAGGCNRAYYRRQADQEAYALVESGSVDPRWPLNDFTIEPDRTSRFYEPHAPDCPPMPPDDPTSHQLMHFVDGKRNWPYERFYGCTDQVENPAWIESLRPYLEDPQEGAEGATGADPTAVLDRQAAVQLALLHSRAYQRELEDLYLSALDVSFQRFRFDTQFFGGNSTSFTKSGPLSGSASDSSELSTDSSVEARRLFATGSQMVVEFANSVVWQFSGSDGYSSITPVSVQLVQPLLRGAGRAVVLEQLTNSERALLSNVRQLERFRRGFYLDIVAGLSAGPGPARGGIGLGTVAPGGGSGVGGYLSLLEQQLQIRNQRTNVASLSRSLERLDEYLRTGITDPVQVEQIRQSLYSSQINLLSRGINYEDQLDRYKIVLGLPPELKVRIEDPLARPLELIDPALLATQNEVARMLDPVREMAATAVSAYEAVQAAPRADRVARAAQAFAAAGDQAIAALQAVAGRDYAKAALAASEAVSNIQSGEKAAEAADAVDLVKTARDVAQAVDDSAKAAQAAHEAVQAGETVAHEELLQTAARAAVQVARMVARATGRTGGIAAGVAGQGAQAAQAIGTAQGAQDATDAAMAAGAALRRARLGFYEEAAEAGEEADGDAQQAASIAAIAARDGEPTQYTGAVQASAQATLATTQTVRVAAKAENTVEVAGQATESATALQGAAKALQDVAKAAEAGNSNEAIEAATVTVDAASAANKAARALIDAAEIVRLLTSAASAPQADERSKAVLNAMTAAVEAATQALQAAERVAAAADQIVQLAEEDDDAKTAKTLANADAAAKAGNQAAEQMAAVAAEVMPRAVEAAVEAAGVASQAAKAAGNAAQAATLAAQGAQAEVLPDRAPEVLRTILASLQNGGRQATVLDRTEGYLAPARDDRDRLVRAIGSRVEQLKILARRKEFERGDVDPGIADPEALRRRVEEIDKSIDRLAETLPKTTKQLREFCRAAAEREAEAGSDLGAWRDLLLGLRRMLDELWSQMLDLSLARATARLDAITLEPVELQSEQALEIARINRRDWMNARAALVDAWRQIEVVANDLKSDLDLVFNGDLTTRSNSLSSVHNTTGQIKVGIEFDAPLTRLAERNEYREVLIDYQQARRQYYAFEDEVSEALRTTLRSLHLAPLEFELQRAAVNTAITRTIRHQVELEMGRETGPTAARDLNDAFGALLNAQNALLRIWLEYEIQRMRLEFDLGVMPLDEQGMWPLDEQGLWIHSEALDGRDSLVPDTLDVLPSDLPMGPPMGPLPELPEPPKDLVRPATALVPSQEESGQAEPQLGGPERRIVPLVMPTGEAELMEPMERIEPTDNPIAPRVHDVDRKRPIDMRRVR